MSLRSQPACQGCQQVPPDRVCGMTIALHSEWQHLQRVLQDSGKAFAPAEEAIAKAFLPALLQEQNERTENFRVQLALPV